MPNNKRKESRKKLVAFTPISDMTDGKLLGYVGDLTLKGLMVIGEKPVEIDRHLMLGLELLSMHITISARAAWCKRDGDTSYYMTGFEFLNVSPENLKIIKQILDRYEFNPVTGTSKVK
ncbi:MAG: PilZ domain-containing protein [Chloroflexi bacterium]|nr:PilZ domain-containing protein [Chloroflexota bacterium]